MNYVRVVGLDLSLTATGIAWDGNATVISTPAARIDGPARLLEIRRRVTGIVTVPRSADIVVLEGYSYGQGMPRKDGKGAMGSPTQAFSTGELGGVIRVALFELGIAYVEVAPGTLKTFATGNGQAKKPEVVACARERFGYRGYNDNEADAWILRAFGMAAYDHPNAPQLPKTHTRALARVAWPQLARPHAELAVRS